MAEIIELDGRRSRPPRCLVDFHVTRQYRQFVEFADPIRGHRYIGFCCGAPVLGKTLSARTYAADDDYDRNFRLIERLMTQVARVMGINQLETITQRSSTPPGRSL